jgi:hypothetical protein
MVLKKAGFISFGLLLLLFLSANKIFSLSFGIEERIALEKNLAQQTRLLVKNIIGSDEFLVFVNIVPDLTVVQEVNNVERKNNKGEKYAFPGAEKLTEEKKKFLPGIPIDAVIESEGFSGGYLSQAIKLPQNMIKKLTVKLIFKEAVSDKLLEEVKEKVSGFIGLNAKRGDELLIEKMVFRQGTTEKVLYWQRMINPHFIWLLAVLILTVFLFGPMRIFLSKLTKAVEVFHVQADSRLVTRSQTDVTGNLGGNFGVGEKILPGEEKPSLPAHKPVGPVVEGEITTKHFNFINQGNLSNLTYILKAEDTSTISIVLNLLSPNHVSQVLDELDYPVREEVLMKMMNIEQYSMEDVGSIEEKIKAKIDYLLGGPEQMGEILNLVDDETREKILKTAQEKDPVLSSQLRKMVVSFEEIYELSLDGLQQLIRSVGLTNFATSLKNESPEKIKELLGKLSKGASEMLEQEMNLSKPTEEKVTLNKRQVVSVLQKLIKEGLVARVGDSESTDEKQGNSVTVENKKIKKNKNN